MRGRLARFLLEHVEEGKGKPEAVSRRWTQEEIAAQIGTVREVVGRTLRAFARAGLLKVERHRIVLLDREGLEEEAGR
ncbi:MAG: helix-turn-helix domain-containing protein [Anaerolineae bacterium]|nr:helix-turn-helix domain-containing protein [Anaerolineae bacterium]